MTDDKTPTVSGEKRRKNTANNTSESGEPKVKKGRGRPKGSKNKIKTAKEKVSKDKKSTVKPANIESADKTSEDESKSADDQA